MGFPDIKFGTCQVCNAKGAPQTEDLSSADAPARTTSGVDGYDPGTGVVLIKYKGKLMCPVCINEAKADTKSLQDAKKHAAKDRFIGKASFNNSVPEGE